MIKLPNINHEIENLYFEFHSDTVHIISEMLKSILMSAIKL